MDSQIMAVDTLLSAAKKLATASGLPWAQVLPVYRALQPADESDSGAWLPKSAGRDVWYAHPNFMSRLLCAIAGATSPATAREAVEWSRALTPDGRSRSLIEGDTPGLLPPPIEQHLGRLLVDRVAAGEVLEVEFRPDRLEIVVSYNDGQRMVYRRPDGDEASRPERGITQRSVIAGSVLVHLSESITWRTPDQAPFRGWMTGDGNEA